MRLTCPNCDAQYEVPDEVIPTAGRDVQCSNCGKTWFQHHPDHMPDADTVDVNAPDPDEEVAPPPQPTPPPTPQRKELDPEVAEILQQEAKAEREARRREPDGLESQPDLGLGDDSSQEPAPQDNQARERMARMRGQEAAISDEAATAAAISSRRDLLPDIEEINSTLRSSTDRGAPSSDPENAIEAPTQKRKKRGFRTGLLAMFLLLVILLLLYIFAPKLAEAVPALDSALNNYVAWVDGLRLWLDGKVRGMAASLDSMAGQSTTTEPAPTE